MALQISSFEDNSPPTCSNLVHPNCGRGAGLTELARLSPMAFKVGAGKVFILVLCRLSALAVYEVRRQRGWAVLAGKLFITELLMCCASRFATLELGEGFICVSRGAWFAYFEGCAAWVGIIRPVVSE